MIYRDFQDMKLSALGFGAMRLPVIDGDDSRIDEAAAFRMVDTAMAAGINYYDTAWGYHDENSETVMGKALKNYPRDQFYVATKFPGYDPSNWGKVKEIFEEHYLPFPKSLVENKLLSLGYTDLILRPMPSFSPETNFAKMDWYRLMARKG